MRASGATAIRPRFGGERLGWLAESYRLMGTQERLAGREPGERRRGGPKPAGRRRSPS